MRFRADEIAASRLTPIFEATLTTAEFSQRLASRSSFVTQSSPDLWTSAADPDVMIVQPGKREEAKEFIGAWLRRSAKKYIHIVDPFFGPQELEFVKLIRSICGDVLIRVLTSRKHQPQDFFATGLQESYQHYWRVRISADIAPDAEIWVASVDDSGDSPIHDRWIITEGSGMELGTSLNSLGAATATKECKIAVMSAEELRKCDERIETYLIGRKREAHGHKVTYWPVML